MISWLVPGKRDSWAAAPTGACGTKCPLLFVWDKTAVGFRSLQLSVRQILLFIDNLEIQLFSTYSTPGFYMLPSREKLFIVTISIPVTCHTYASPAHQCLSSLPQTCTRQVTYSLGLCTWPLSTKTQNEADLDPTLLCSLAACFKRAASILYQLCPLVDT